MLQASSVNSPQKPPSCFALTPSNLVTLDISLPITPLTGDLNMNCMSPTDKLTVSRCRSTVNSPVPWFNVYDFTSSERWIATRMYFSRMWLKVVVSSVTAVAVVKSSREMKRSIFAGDDMFDRIELKWNMVKLV
ncbi:hypothetical protein HanRHA438_Chr14g0659261 [Helianthus annuus]|uniref:Uncharacterized protein n=1 Tax=Helianthus annuus TaxID=4232 RepID=A0A9K3E9J3_HELAN|nr:hypothetical protein HanXRQr2_Chr14g0648671 [Helianthus annuus]KAJ0854137.1 hypothetical protein HanRHA438_Chr14g0659261 [Helianthus annuus]